MLKDIEINYASCKDIGNRKTGITIELVCKKVNYKTFRASINESWYNVMRNVFECENDLYNALYERVENELEWQIKEWQNELRFLK